MKRLLDSFKNTVNPHLFCGLLLVAGVVLAGCQTINTKEPIPLAGFVDFKVKEQSAPNKLQLAITGGYGCGFAAVGIIKTNYLADKVLIEVFPRSPARDTSGLLNLSIDIPDDVNLIEFGKPGIVIWQRGVGVKLPK